MTGTAAAQVHGKDGTAQVQIIDLHRQSHEEDAPILRKDPGHPCVLQPQRRAVDVPRPGRTSHVLEQRPYL